jgi:hypothetical protein
MSCQHIHNELEINDIQVLIRAVDASAARIVNTERSSAVLGRAGSITACLADGTQWVIDSSLVRQQTNDEVFAYK